MEDVLYAGGLLEGIDHVRRSCEVEMVKAAKPRGICAFADARKKSMNGFFVITFRRTSTLLLAICVEEIQGVPFEIRVIAEGLGRRPRPEA